jgi:uncharacterized protein YndB with AHSA1/START domain/DNA-binding transcriptional ArsR family regulator
VDAVFKALADPTRRALLDRLHDRNGQTLGELCEGLDMARQSVSKHLAVVEAAGLVVTQWRGREKLHFLNAAPITAIADRWMSRYDRRRAEALADLRAALEQGGPMSDTEFVYTTYIKTTPERLWQALTDPAFTKRYWGVELTSDWEKGSTITWQINDLTIADPEQVVLESEPPRLLSYTWHTVPENFHEVTGGTAEEAAALAAEPRSQVRFEIEPAGDLVMLTLTHSGFESGSGMLEGISGGWPAIMASLKTLLETGTSLSE